MAEEIEKAGPPVPQPQSPFAKPIDPKGDITNSIMSTPGAAPTWDLSGAANATTFSEIGTSGLRAFAGWVKEEFLPELQGRQGAQKFREMGDNSPTVGAVMHAIKSTMRKVEWRVIPPNDSGPAKELADFIDSCRDDMCYDDQTEILTEAGWVKFSERGRRSLRVAQRTADGKLEYVRPRRWNCFDYDGELLGYKGDAVDFLVTPNHRLLFAPRTGRKHDSSQKTSLGIHPCEEVFGHSGWVSKAVHWRGESQAFWRAPRWLELLGFFVADGCAIEHQVYLIQKETAYVTKLLADTGFNKGVWRCRSVNGAYQWVLSDAQWARELRANFGVGSRNKRLPTWLMRLPPEDLREFLRGFAEGDGWEANTGLVSLSTASKQLADDLQIIAMKAGYAANVSSRIQSHGFSIGSTQYRVAIWSERKDHLQPYLKAGRGWYRHLYSGKVYCVSVPSGVVMVRRNGKAFWCGNSHTWEDLVDENLSALQYGYAPHEIVYKRRLGKKPPNGADGTDDPPKSGYDDGKIGWRRIPIRGQDTIIQWFFDSYGAIKGVRQLPWTGIMRDIPIEKMLLFRVGLRKNNPEGRSLLRSSYVPYYFIKRLQEQEAIMGERMGGVPVVKVPMAMIEAANNGDAKAQASMNSFKNLAVNLRIDEQMGVVMPSDVWQGANGPSAAPMFVLELITPSGGARTAMNFEAAITRYNISIMTSVLADFLTLGHEARGSQSLAVTKVDLFFQAIEGYLNSFAAIYNRYAIPRLWELNGLNPDLMPQLEPDLAQRVDLDVLSNYVLRMSQAGMPMFPNEDLQTFLLDAAGMPDVSDPRALQAAGLMDDQLDREDDKEDAVLDNMQNPPQPAAKPNGKTSNLDKMVLASLAKRIIRMQGPRFGISTKRHKHNGATRHA